MADYRVVIDAGHGGADGGASGNGIVEKDYTLKISQYMDKRLRELGVPTKMTRSTDETISNSTRTSRVLDAFGNNSNVIVVSNHINAGGGDGAEVIYALRNNSNLASKVLDSIGATGQNTRKFYQLRLPSDPSKDYYFMLRETGKTQPIIVEYGFLDSSKDDVNQIKNNWQAMTEGVVKALAGYMGVPYKAPGTSGGTGGNTTDGYYTVAKGDSLWKVANQFGLTVDKLKELNKLTTDVISVGQRLRVNEGDLNIPNDYVLYRVQPGDNLYNIANRYNTTVSELMKINNLTSSTLQVNQELYVPNTGDNNSGGATSNEPTYTVKSGDNLYSIANRYGTTVDEIVKTNNLPSTILTVGQVLRIPTSTDYQNYTVTRGDSLWKIASQFGTTVNNLRSINNLISDTLSIGQVLKVPKK